MNRRIALIVLAVALALVGTGAVYAYVKHADQRAIAKTDATKVLIAQKQIPAGTTWSDVVKGGYVRLDRIPALSAPSDAVQSTSADILTTDVATSSIAPGQVVQRLMFGAEKAITGPIQIPKDKIAVTVSLKGGADVAGYVEQGSKVAIFGTYKLKAPTNTVNDGTLGGTDLYATKLITTDVLVLATSERSPSDVNGARSSSNNSNSSNDDILVTLAVSQTDAQKIILSQTVGQLYLGLLSDNSNVDPNDRGVLGYTTFRPAPIFVQ